MGAATANGSSCYYEGGCERGGGGMDTGGGGYLMIGGEIGFESSSSLSSNGIFLFEGAFLVIKGFAINA